MEAESNMISGYMEAYAMACRALKEKDAGQIAENAGCGYNAETGRLILRFLGEEYWAHHPDGEIGRMDGKAVAITVQVLILHYLLHAKKTAPSGNLISFREVRGGGENYYPSFQKRAEIPLQKAFEASPKLLVQCGLQLGGTMAHFGDASITLSVFPNVPVTYVVWQKDEELPASATILFDGNVSRYLPCEDVVLAASMGTYALLYELKKLAARSE